MELDARKEQILQAIIQDYITSAEPVGSKTLVRKYDLHVSAATIRKEMSELESLGYLQQPHTSAGRVPSLKGYRFYVDCLLQPTKISDEEKTFVENWFRHKVDSVDQMFQSTAKLLAKITHNVTLVLAAEAVHAKLKYIRFLPLDAQRAIMLVVADNGQVEHSLYKKPAGVDLDDLNAVAQKLTNYLSGLPMDRIDEKVINAFHGNIVDDAQLYRQAFQAIGQAFRKKQQLYRGGTLELLHKPEFRDVDKAQSLFRLLDEQDVVASILEDAGEDKPVTVRIGKEARLSPIDDCSIIEATFSDHEVVLGKLAVLGPARMEYAKIIGLLDFMKQHVTHMLAQYHEKTRQ